MTDINTSINISPSCKDIVVEIKETKDKNKEHIKNLRRAWTNEEVVLNFAYYFFEYESKLDSWDRTILPNSIKIENNIINNNNINNIPADTTIDLTKKNLLLHKHIRSCLHNQLGGKEEFKCEPEFLGIADLVTNTRLIEIKPFDEALDALGQLLKYNRDTRLTKLKKTLYLYDHQNKSKEKKDMISDIFGKNEIDVFFYTDIMKIEEDDDEIS